jgi:hypothetical protein
VGRLPTWGGFHPEIMEGVHAIMLAQITLAWTAFEVLSADLWVAAVDERPRPLATNFANKCPDNNENNQEKSIPISALARYGKNDFDLSKSMGTMFAEQKKADFTSLYSTALAYERAFGRRIVALDATDLLLLEKVRNLILHRGGVVDGKFEKFLQDRHLQSDPHCSGAEKGKPFPINPKVATRLVTASVDAGKELIGFVVSMHNLAIADDAQPDL